MIVKAKIGYMVNLKTDKEGLSKMVTGICIRETGNSYELSFMGNQPVWHYECEINFKKNKEVKIGFRK